MTSIFLKSCCKLDREPNYFEILEIENTTPTPLQVKKSYQKLMNQIAQESKVANVDPSIQEDLEQAASGNKTDPKTKGKKDKERKSRKKKKKSRKDMTPEEIKIDDKKKKL